MNINYDNIIESAKNDVKPLYEQRGRYYHSFKHIENLLKQIDTNFSQVKDSQIEFNKFVYQLAALFHDVIYDPTSSSNEEDSLEFFKNYLNTKHYLFSDLDNCGSENFYLRNKIFRHVKYCIDSTREKSESKNLFRYLDRKILESTNVSELINWELGISKEYSMYPYSKYIEGRLEFLTKNNIYLLKDFVQNRKINIGLFVGTFNPFHIGHKNVLDKADDLFDKVIVVPAINSDKANNKKINWELKTHEIILWDNLLYKLYKKLMDTNLYNKITFVRGIRNTSDYSYEQNWMYWMEDLFNKHNLGKPNFVLIPCDKQFEHISSSSVRAISEYDSEDIKKYL